MPQNIPDNTDFNQHTHTPMGAPVPTSPQIISQPTYVQPSTPDGMGGGDMQGGGGGFQGQEIPDYSLPPDVPPKLPPPPETPPFEEAVGISAGTICCVGFNPEESMLEAIIQIDRSSPQLAQLLDCSRGLVAH